jgi:hypothetical protein
MCSQHRSESGCYDDRSEKASVPNTSNCASIGRLQKCFGNTINIGALLGRAAHKTTRVLPPKKVAIHLFRQKNESVVCSDVIAKSEHTTGVTRHLYVSGVLSLISEHVRGPRQRATRWGVMVGKRTTRDSKFCHEESHLYNGMWLVKSGLQVQHPRPSRGGRSEHVIS